MILLVKASSPSEALQRAIALGWHTDGRAILDSEDAGQFMVIVGDEGQEADDAKIWEESRYEFFV